MTPPYTHTGKQVFRDGQHFADAVSVEAAALIVRVSNDVAAKLHPPAA